MFFINIFRFIILIISLIIFQNCQEEDNPCPDSTADQWSLETSPAVVTGGSWYKPAKTVTWQIQLTGTINTSYGVELYDVDLFDVSTIEISSLHASGKKVICYFSAGSYEDWRSDIDKFNHNDYGKPLDDWEGEYWLDIRSQNVYSIMLDRLDLAVSKGCDGVDPDNVDVYTQDSCFDISADEQLAYNRNLANEAHNRNLSVGLKNDPGQISDLANYYDFSVSEQCHVYSECDLYQPVLTANKPVLEIEYDLSYVNDSTARAQMCADSNALGIRTLIMPDILDDSFRISCF
jgi:hypothetical protein